MLPWVLFIITLILFLLTLFFYNYSLYKKCFHDWELMKNESYGFTTWITIKKCKHCHEVISKRSEC